MNDQNVKIVSRIYYSAFRYEMDCLSDFHEKTENLLKRELKKFLLKSAQKISLLTKEEKIEYYDIVSDEDENLRKRFPYLLKSSNFLLFYGFFEAELEKICRIFQRTGEYEDTLGSSRDKGIIRSRKYLKNIVGLNFENLDVVWDNLIKYNFVRNIIAHSNGKIPKGSAKEIQFESKFSGNASVRLNQYNILEMDDEFIDEELKNISKFLTDIYLQIRKDNK